jgi:hypothetical protein
MAPAGPEKVIVCGPPCRRANRDRCIGLGAARSGTAGTDPVNLWRIAILDGVPARQAVRYVASTTRRAVETFCQRRYVTRFRAIS